MVKLATDYNLNSATKDLDKILQYAIKQEAEEILFDVKSDTATIFYKVLGSWEKVFDLSLTQMSGLKSRLQELAGVEAFKKTVPQSGNFKISVAGFKFIFQLSINPSVEGEKILLDIYKEKLQLFTLRQLGLLKRDLSVLERNLHRGRGMNIVLGDFNSGRTATLYSLLDFLNKPGVNVCTIEDELYYDLPSVNQIKIDVLHGLNSHLALLSLTKQDPDVIMLSDINDQGTARECFLAADKGHAVLAGLYSRNILTAMSFLRDLGISLHLFLQAVNIVLNQRLAKKICPHCITKSSPGHNQLRRLKEIIDLPSILERTQGEGLFPPLVQKIEDIQFYKGKGCSRCEETGLWGSIGVFEILEITTEVKNLVANGHLSGIKNEIKNQGRLYLEEDAFIKAATGIISIDEVLRIGESL